MKENKLQQEEMYYTFQNMEYLKTMRYLRQLLTKVDAQLTSQRLGKSVTYLDKYGVSKKRYVPDESLPETKTLVTYKKTLIKERNSIKEKYKDSKFKVIVNDLKSAIEDLNSSDVQKEITAVRNTSSQAPSIKKLIGLEKNQSYKGKFEGESNNPLLKL